MSLFLIIVIGIGWFFSELMDSRNILYFAVGFSLLMNIFSYWYSDKVVLKMSGAKQIKREENRNLFDTVERLSRQAHLPIPKVYIMNDQSLNAFATGRNAKNSAVAVTQGLLNVLEQRELEGVIAHELSHIQNNDILISTIIVVLVGFVSLLSDFFLRMSIFGGLRDNENNSAGSVMAIVGIVLAILAPFVAMIIQLAISRKREFLADASGASLTHNPSGLASALEKISSSSVQMKKASRATAHIFISNPYKKNSKHSVGQRKRTSFLAKMFMTHPPTEERINALLGRR
ncbi:MAG: M48 family metalloprotease [Candidatus Pacebacteria bacterium]|nr:M48 family metalloprotease [Candidatus Paceibacterota bacterium]